MKFSPVTHPYCLFGPELGHALDVFDSEPTVKVQQLLDLGLSTTDIRWLASTGAVDLNQLNVISKATEVTLTPLGRKWVATLQS